MIKIGEQIWSDKNIDIFEYRNGDSVICANSSEEWESANKKKLALIAISCCLQII